jgi:SH3-like domain-containing protein
MRALVLAVLLAACVPAVAHAQTLTPFENPQPTLPPKKSAAAATVKSKSAVHHPATKTSSAKTSSAKTTSSKTASTKTASSKTRVVKASASKSDVKKTVTAKPHVPVVAAHHAAQVRRPLRPTVENPTTPKPPPEKPAEKTAAAPAPKAPEPPPVPADVGTNTGLHLPRFASLKSDDVNMRSGPGERYPVLWEYQRRDLPVKIEREIDVWRLVEDMDGIKGWVHQATLTGRRDFVVTGTANVIVRSQANDTSEAVAVLKPGVIGRIKSCDAASVWCAVEVSSYQGFLKRSDFYGLLDGETIAP